MNNIFHRRGWSWYAAKTPFWLKWFYKKLLWQVPAVTKEVYLTFDDGPIPEVTEYVLNLLNEYTVKAHFFCIGKNVQEHPGIYQRILSEGHRTGNHTQHHLNGWKTSTTDYINNIMEAAAFLETPLFRPPYGRITKRQIKGIQKITVKDKNMQIIMWDVLSGDFDTSISPEKCYQNVVRNIQPGSIIVFHDSIKAFPNMQPVLPKVLQWLKENGYQVKLLP